MANARQRNNDGKQTAQRKHDCQSLGTSNCYIAFCACFARHYVNSIAYLHTYIQYKPLHMLYWYIQGISLCNPGARKSLTCKERKKNIK